MVFEVAVHNRPGGDQILAPGRSRRTPLSSRRRSTARRHRQSNARVGHHLLSLADHNSGRDDGTLLVERAGTGGEHPTRRPPGHSRRRRREHARASWGRSSPLIPSPVVVVRSSSCDTDATLGEVRWESAPPHPPRAAGGATAVTPGPSPRARGPRRRSAWPPRARRSGGNGSVSASGGMGAAQSGPITLAKRWPHQAGE